MPLGLWHNAFAVRAVRICLRTPSNRPPRYSRYFWLHARRKRLPGIDELFAVISRWGGLAESRVLLRGIRLPAPQAALLNASMGHALDFDDTLDIGGSIHPGVSVLGSVIATCDSLGGVAGRGCPIGGRPGAGYFLPHRAREHARSRLASHRGDRGIRRHGGSRQADPPNAGADGGRHRHRLQPRRRQSPMHSGRGTDQADAGRPSGERRRALGSFGENRVLPARATFLAAVSGFWSCTSRTGTTPLSSSATSARLSAARRWPTSPIPAVGRCMRPSMPRWRREHVSRSRGPTTLNR